MANIILRNKELDKTWTAVETLLKVDGAKSVVIPHQPRYNIAASGFALSMVLQPGTAFSLSKKTVGGYTLTYASGNLTWTVFNTTTSLSVSVPASSTYKNYVFPYVTSAGYVGLKVINSAGVAESVSSTTIAGDFSNSANKVVSGTCLIGFYAVYDKVPSALEISAMVNPSYGEVAIIPQTLHPNVQGYWTMQERLGNKAYDSVELFNPAKTAAGFPTLTGNHADLLNFSDVELRNYRLDFYTKQTSNALMRGFNGTDQYVTTSEQVITDSDSFTFEFEAVFQDFSLGRMAGRGFDGFGNGWNIGFEISNTDGTLLFGITFPGQSVFLFSSNASVFLKANKKYHIAGRWNFITKLLELLIDGQLIISNPVSNQNSLRSSTMGVVMGTSGSPALAKAKCAISNLRVWNTVRTDQQLKDNIGVLLPPQAGLKLQWENEPTGTQCLDTSGNAYHGTRNGSANIVLYEKATGLPEITNALLLDATHTITYPLIGTVQVDFKGYAVQAYCVKTGQTLTNLETKWLQKNLLFANPNPAILRKLDAYYLLGNVDAANNRVKNLLADTNHAPVSSNFSTVTINSLR